ncbi:hypothetical protein DENSPDRAFT_832168 [Dentipellis sp. KUC8613]|nr:hypothetical protein DENSPDRAFT_832168 [Dentipellis sp. KUC8613]
MSVPLLAESLTKDTGEHSDDLESIYWLLLYHGLRYQRKPRAVFGLSGLNEVLEMIFDEQFKGVNDRLSGGGGKKLHLQSSELDDELLEDIFHAPFASLLQDLRDIFVKALFPSRHMYRRILGEDKHTFEEYRRALEECRRTQKELQSQARVSLQNTDVIHAILTRCLAQEGWPEGDGAVEPSLQPASEDEDEDDEDENGGEGEEDEGKHEEDKEEVSSA